MSGRVLKVTCVPMSLGPDPGGQGLRAEARPAALHSLTGGRKKCR